MNKTAPQGEKKNQQYLPPTDGAIISGSDHDYFWANKVANRLSEDGLFVMTGASVNVIKW